MLIRRENLTDRAVVFDLHAAAFAPPDGTPAVEAPLAERLRRDGDVDPRLSLVAEVDGTVVGHVLCSRATLGGRPSLGLGPIGVLPDHQRRGVGSALMHAILAAADALDAPEVVLLGDPRYYRRFGFRLAEPLGIVPPNPEWAPHLQVRTLAAWTGEGGDFRYAPAFDDL